MTTPARNSISTGDWLSYSAEETFKLGRQIGAQLEGGETLLLDGPLGAGKTIFVKGLAAGLELDPEEVTSPSFTLVNPYVGRLTLFHIDLYRLEEGGTAANAVDLEELLSDERAVIVIEWAERLRNYPLPSRTWRVSIRGDGDAPRQIKLSIADNVID
jgi:tRNA threonylcarbamoyladenosine biosynthesis protein TsaE